MKRKSIALAATLLSFPLFLSGCQMTMPTSPRSIHHAATTADPDSSPVLHFKQHSFGSLCFDTYGCKVVYAGLVEADDPPDKKWKSFSEWAGSEGESALKKAGGGGYIGIRNFPAPVRVSWKSKDGTFHTAEVDIGKIFKDEVIIHHLPLREFPHAPENTLQDVTILLVVDDRTIKVYMLSNINMHFYLTLAYSQTF